MNWGECRCCFFLEKKTLVLCSYRFWIKTKKKKKNTKKLKLNYNRVGAMIGQKKKKKKEENQKGWNSTLNGDKIVLCIKALFSLLFSL